ncbi:MAG: hypothetical protein L0215_02540 [Gemmataceae bacterium]|nr:hypothetical protein [Gemmataceae bacterium]
MAKKTAGESKMGYFRRVYEENRPWIKLRSNAKMVERWLADHPGHTEMPDDMRGTMANVKSILRSKRRRRKKAAQEAGVVPMIKPRPANLDNLEIEIDDCIMMAHRINPTGLEDIIKLLRRARKEVVLKMGQ